MWYTTSAARTLLPQSFLQLQISAKEVFWEKMGTVAGFWVLATKTKLTKPTQTSLTKPRLVNVVADAARAGLAVNGKLSPTTITRLGGTAMLCYAMQLCSYAVLCYVHIIDKRFCITASCGPNVTMLYE